MSQTDGTTAEAARPLGPIELELDHMRDALRDLTMQIDTIVDQLAPVMGGQKNPEPDGASMVVEEHADMSVIQATLIDFRRMLATQTGRLVAASGRLEL